MHRGHRIRPSARLDTRQLRPLRSRHHHALGSLGDLLGGVVARLRHHRAAAPMHRGHRVVVNRRVNCYHVRDIFRRKRARCRLVGQCLFMRRDDRCIFLRLILDGCQFRLFGGGKPPNFGSLRDFVEAAPTDLTGLTKFARQDHRQVAVVIEGDSSARPLRHIRQNGLGVHVSRSEPDRPLNFSFQLLDGRAEIIQLIVQNPSAERTGFLKIGGALHDQPPP